MPEAHRCPHCRAVTRPHCRLTKCEWRVCTNLRCLSFGVPGGVWKTRVPEGNK